jgi:hypothetical protein
MYGSYSYNVTVLVWGFSFLTYSNIHKAYKYCDMTVLYSIYSTVVVVLLYTVAYCTVAVDFHCEVDL